MAKYKPSNKNIIQHSVLQVSKQEQLKIATVSCSIKTTDIQLIYNVRSYNACGAVRKTTTDGYVDDEHHISWLCVDDDNSWLLMAMLETPH